MRAWTWKIAVQTFRHNTTLMPCWLHMSDNGWIPYTGCLPRALVRSFLVQSFLSSPAASCEILSMLLKSISAEMNRGLSRATRVTRVSRRAARAGTRGKNKKKKRKKKKKKTASEYYEQAVFMHTHKFIRPANISVRSIALTRCKRARIETLVQAYRGWKISYVPCNRCRMCSFVRFM